MDYKERDRLETLLEGATVVEVSILGITLEKDGKRYEATWEPDGYGGTDYKITEWLTNAL